MATKKITQLTVGTSFNLTDLFEKVNSPSGTPASQSLTGTKIRQGILQTTDGFNFSFGGLQSGSGHTAGSLSLVQPDPNTGAPFGLRFIADGVDASIAPDPVSGTFSVKYGTVQVSLDSANNQVNIQTSAILFNNNLVLDWNSGGGSTVIGDGSLIGDWTVASGAGGNGNLNVQGTLALPPAGDAPSNTVTPAGWIKIAVSGGDAWLPYYT